MAKIQLNITVPKWISVSRRSRWAAWAQWQWFVGADNLMRAKITLSCSSTTGLGNNGEALQ
jgi:hypothetical protein